MMKFMIEWLWRLWASLIFAVAVSASAPAAAQSDGKVIIFAAASMKTALDAVLAEWKKETVKDAIVSYASSAVIARQIEQGAPADMFISADLEWMDWLQQRNLIKVETRKTLLGNALVLVAPTASTMTLKLAPGVDLVGALGDSRLAVCTIASCPAGKYGRQSLEKLSIWAKVEPKLAQADNVRAALALVARGEAKFGIVYATDAKAEPQVKVIDTFPEDSHDPVLYPFALTASSKNPDAAALLSYLASPPASKIFAGQGFTVLAK